MSKKNNFNTAGQRFNMRLKPICLAMAGIFPAIASAGAIYPATQGQGPSNTAQMNQSANGTPVIDIVDPNSQGISHNKFSEFNVDEKGVIFNNSMQDGSSQIGGFVIKNPNLNHESSVIISEVTGTKGTQLNGTMEVFGKQADIVIANQNGISVNGATTVNASNLTLTTGKINPQADGSVQISVEKGSVNIEGKGISTEGLGYFDIVSRSAKLEGEIAGQSDIKIVTGLNDYDPKSRTHTVRDANASDRPDVSIDGSALGSMYGGRIQLISTETGAGVRHEGSIIGNQGIEISANGDLRLSGVKSEQGAITLNGNNINVQKNSNGDGGIDSQLDLMINALANVNLGADAISEQGHITINADSMLQNAATLMARNGQSASVNIPSIQINVANDYQIIGSLYAVDQDGEAISGAVISLEDGDYVVRRNGQVIDASVASNAQVISNSGDIAIKAKSFNNNNSGIVAKQGALVFNIDELAENNGMINASGKLTVNSRAFKNKGIIFTDSQIINTGSFENSGGDYAQNAINVTADSVDNSGTIISTDSDIQLDVNGAVANNSGRIAANNVTVNQKNKSDKSAVFTNSGNIDTVASLRINSDSLKNSGKLTVGETADFALTKELKNSGVDAEIISGQDLLIYSNLDDNALSIFNESGWIQGDNLRLDHLDTVSNTGEATIIAVGEMAFNNIKNIFNDNSLIKADSVLLSQIENVNNTNNALIEGASALGINNVTQLNNDTSTLQSDGDVTLDSIVGVVNTQGLISSGTTLTLSNIDKILNTSASTIQASAALLINKITTLENTTGSVLLSQDTMNIDSAKNIHNDTDSQIVSETALNISNADSLTNEGLIQSNSDLNINHIVNLLNTSETAIIAGLGNLTIDNISNLSNMEQATLSAGLELVLSSIETLVNNAASIGSEGSVSISATDLSNLSGSIQSYGDIVLKITNILQNMSSDGGFDEYNNPLTNTADISSDGGSVNITTDKLINNSDILADNVLIDVNNLDNTLGTIEGYNTAEVKVKNDFINKEGTIRGDNKMSLDMVKDFIFNDDIGSIESSSDLNIHSDGNIDIYNTMESSGNLTLDAGKDLTNYSAILAVNDITLKGKNVTNKYIPDTLDSDGKVISKGLSALIWSGGNLNIDAREGTFHNEKYGNVLSVGNMGIIANEIINDAGIIRSEGDMALDARSIQNLSEYSGGDWKTGPIQEGHGFTSDYSKVATYVSWTINTYLPTLSSDIALVTTAEISSGGKMKINQGGIFENTTENPLEVNNEGGIIQSAGDMVITGNLTNKPKYTEASLYDYLNEPLAKPITIDYYWKLVASGGSSASFNTVYSFLDWMFGNGKPSSQSGDELSKSNFLETLRKAANGGSDSQASPQLNTVMTMIFGESWLTTDLGTLRSDWANLGKSADSSDIGTDAALKEKGFYFLPNEKGSIVSMGNFTHNGGTLDNGIGEFSTETQGNTSVNVEKVGDQEITPIGGSTEVLVNLKDIEEFRAGISPMSSIDAMSKLPALFPYSDGWNSRNGTDVNVKNGPSNSITPVYETRPGMIDQSEYIGSDYFFEQVGYSPNTPVYVIGDNYYIDELVRREVNDSVGTYFAVRDGVEGVDMVQMLMDNANAVVNNGVTVTDPVTGETSTQNLGLEVGVPPTSDQLSKLDKDIVWFVNQTIDGEQVLVPFVYLANTTLDDMSNSAKTSSGSAVIHAEGDVNIDASSVNNSNAIISAGNNVNIQSEGDINNKSSGASGGIIAKNDVDMNSANGSINNDGAYIKAGSDINMLAENGSIETTASVGRDEQGKQQVHTYDDAISAGGDINIKAKDITSNAAIIEAGNDINMKSTEGDITFNDMHEISADYQNDMDSKNAINFRKTETETTTATSVAGQVTAGGKLNIDSAKDVIMKGGEYSGTDGSITAAGDVDMQATQDYSHTEETVRVREFSLTGQGNAMGYSASAESSGLDGNSTSTSSGDYGYDYGSEAAGNGSHSPGKSAVGPIAETFIGYRSSTDTSTEDIKTNNNASFNFSNDLNVEAKTVDIGGADIAAGNGLNITADELKTTKYIDTDDTTFTHENLSIGLTTSVSSVFTDILDKDAGMIESKVDNPDVGFDAVTTAAQTAGDVTNLIFNDYASINATLGVDYSQSSGASQTTSENITHIDAGKVNIKTKGDTTLAGTDIKANDVTIDAGGDVNMRAAEKTTSYNEDGMYVSVGVSVGAAVDKDSAGAGVSLDASGGNNQENDSSKSYANTTVNADNVSIKSGNDTNLIGADITAKTADVTTGGDLNIASVQDTVNNDASSWHAGVSAGVAVTTDGGVIPTFSANGGGGSDFHDSALTDTQSGIHTSGQLDVTTGGDLNMTGGHLVSDDHTGTVDTAGNINVQDLKDTTEQDGAYGGGGGGVTKTGVSVNMYAQTTDEIHYQEDQHSTIDVGTLDKSKVVGDLNTDGSKLSDVVKDEKEWGSDISATVSVPTPSKKGSYDVDQPDAKKPADVEPISHKPIDADPVKPKVEPKVEPVVDPKKHHADSEDVPEVKPDVSKDLVKPTVDPKVEPVEPKVEPVVDPKKHDADSEDVPKKNPDVSKDPVKPKADPAQPDATDGGKKPDDVKKLPKPTVVIPDPVVLSPGSSTGKTSWIDPPKGGIGKNGTAFEGLPKSGGSKAYDIAPKASSVEKTAEAKKIDPSQYNGKKWPIAKNPSKDIILSPGSSTNNIPSNATPSNGNTSNGGTYEGQPVRQPVKQLPDGASNWTPLLPEHTMSAEHTYQDTEWSVSNTKINQRGGPVA